MSNLLFKTGRIYYIQKRNIVQLAKKINPQMLVEQKNYILNKNIFMRYCEHFKNKSLAQLLNDKLFIEHMDDCIYKEPTLQSRAFQLALEVTYSKRKFSQESLQQVYKNDFIVQDTFNVNNGLCDQSTIYTAILAKKIVNYFNLNSTDLIVNSTPLYLTKNKTTELMQFDMNHNKTITGNTCPDMTLKAQPYDIKDQKEIFYSKNHVYFIDLENIKQKGHVILDQLEKALKNSLKNPQIKLSEDVRTFTNDILQNLKDKYHLPIENRIEFLNKLLIKSNVPKDFKMPLFIPIKKVVLDDLPSVEVKNVPLDKGHLTDVKAKKAIMGILDTYNSNIKTIIQKATSGSIQFNNSNLDDID